LTLLAKVVINLKCFEFPRSEPLSFSATAFLCYTLYGGCGGTETLPLALPISCGRVARFYP